MYLKLIAVIFSVRGAEATNIMIMISMCLLYFAFRYISEAILISKFQITNTEETKTMNFLFKCPTTAKYKTSCGLNNEIMGYTFEEEFRLDHPETVGETDSHFDLDNYKDWLEAQLIEARKQLALHNVVGRSEQLVCTCENSEKEKDSLVPVYCHTCNAYVHTNCL